MEKLGLALKRNKRAVAFGIAGIAVGGILRGFLPPFVIDQPFLHDFLVGPPMVGLFAVIAAGLAYCSARHGTRVAKENAEKATAVARRNAESAEQAATKNAQRAEWWKRAEWAMNLTLSKMENERRIG